MRRWIAFALALPVYLLVLMVCGTLLLVAIAEPDEIVLQPANIVEVLGDCFEEGGWWTFAGIPALVIVALQFVFLVPQFARRPPRETRGRSLTVSLIVGGLVAGLGTAGLAAAATDLIAVLRSDVDLDNKGLLVWVPVVLLLVGWVFWTAVLLAFMRGIWADRTLGRVVGLLLAGTLLEVLVVVPLDIVVRRRTNCYCGTGTFTALAMATIATLWLAGPGVVIALTSHRHRRWRATHCPRCGYPRGPSPGAQCPECGCDWGGAIATMKGD